MIVLEEGNSLNTTILQLKKEKEELKEKFYQTICEKNWLDKVLNVALEQLKRSEEMTRLEEENKEQAYAGLGVISSIISAHRGELGRAWHQRYECKDTWIKSTRAHKEAKDEYEARIQALEVESKA